MILSMLKIKLHHGKKYGLTSGLRSKWSFQVPTSKLDANWTVYCIYVVLIMMVKSMLIAEYIFSYFSCNGFSSCYHIVLYLYFFSLLLSASLLQLYNQPKGMIEIISTCQSSWIIHQDRPVLMLDPQSFYLLQRAPFTLSNFMMGVHPEGEDKIVWSLDSRGIFAVKSLCEKRLGSNCPSFPAKAIWKSKAPTKARFLAWAEC